MVPLDRNPRDASSEMSLQRLHYYTTVLLPLLVPVWHLKKDVASEVTLPQMKFHVSPSGTDTSKLLMGKYSFMPDFTATIIRKLRNDFCTSIHCIILAMLKSPNKNEWPKTAQLHTRSQMFLKGDEWGKSLAFGSGSKSLHWGPLIKAAVNSEANQSKVKGKA